MLQASNISKRYGDTALLTGVSFTLNPGDCAGLVGRNGCGKTTLLRILVGEVQPDTGSVRVDPVGASVGYLEQGLSYGDSDTLETVLLAENLELLEAEAHVAQLAAAMAAAQAEALPHAMDAYADALARLEHLASSQVPEHEAKEVLAGLDLAGHPLDTPVKHLSGGQKTRLGLARLLLKRPQVLLLDEPTNHLDIEALEWLQNWLASYAGAVLLVSHDRAFLDGTVNWIFELDARTHQLTPYSGAYMDYIEAKRRETERQWEAYDAQQERIAQLTGEARRLSGYASNIERGTIDFAPRKIAKGIARRAVVQRRRIERELAQARIERPGLSWQMKLEFVDTPNSGKDVLVFEHVDVGYGKRALIGDMDQVLRQGERVALIGANGSGKTTLLRSITGEIPPLSGEIRLGANVTPGYYAQEQENLDPQTTPLSVIRQVARPSSAAAVMSETEARSFLHYFLFAGDDVFTPVGSLSHGERARLVLARLVAAGCNLLLLDEPINHLDIPSRASFEQAIAAFEGTVLAVVHDRHFINAFATRVWAIHDRELHSYVDLEDYQRIRRRRAGDPTQRPRPDIRPGCTPSP